MHCEIIDHYFSIIFTEMQLKKEKVFFGCQVLGVQTIMLVSKMACICYWFVESCIFISNCFVKYSFSIFNENSKLVWTTQSYNTRSSWNGLLFLPSLTQSDLREYQLPIPTAHTWNYFQRKLTEEKFLWLTSSLKILLVKFFISEYI